MKRILLMVVFGLIFAGTLGFAGAARADDAARKACTDAMNADPSFANAIIATANADLASKIHNYDIKFTTLQEDAADKVATNQRHVLYAYIAIWLAAAGFVGFLWRKQQALKSQIARLESDLAKALAEDAAAEKSS
jgi:hypothetical protein